MFALAFQKLYHFIISSYFICVFLNNLNFDSESCEKLALKKGDNSYRKIAQLVNKSEYNALYFKIIVRFYI